MHSGDAEVTNRSFKTPVLYVLYIPYCTSAVQYGTVYTVLYLCSTVRYTAHRTVLVRYSSVLCALGKVTRCEELAPYSPFLQTVGPC